MSAKLQLGLVHPAVRRLAVGSALAQNLVLDGGFETSATFPVTQGGGFMYREGQQGWWRFGTTNGTNPGAYVATANGSSGLGPNTIGVGQYAVLQDYRNSPIKPSLTTNIVLAAASNINLSFLYGTRNSAESGTIFAYLDAVLTSAPGYAYASGGTLIGQAAVTGPSGTFSAALTNVSAGAHTLTIVFAGSAALTDAALHIDNVMLTATASGGGTVPEIDPKAESCGLAVFCGVLMLLGFRRKAVPSVAL